MARLYTLQSLLREEHAIELEEHRRQALNIRNMTLSIRQDDYVEIFRLSEHLINKLEQDLHPYMAITQSSHQGLSPKTKILCALSFLASGSYQKTIKQNVITYMSQASVSRCIKEVVDALNNRAITWKYIRFPQNFQERQVLKERFYQRFNIPGVIGCIDGTLVSMIRPKDNEERFYCRKGYHARNVQLITDADLDILHVDPSYGGATHDSFIFNYCSIKYHLENLTTAGERVVLLGDSGYAQRAYMMTPVGNAEDNSPQEHYNNLQMTARNSVERAIGLLKGRFRCLLSHRALHYHPDVVGKIVIACCVLHNMCNRAGMPAFELTDNEIVDEVTLTTTVMQQTLARNLLSRAALTEGETRRTELINNLWHARSQ